MFSEKIKRALRLRLRLPQLGLALRKFARAFTRATEELRKDLARWGWAVVCTNLVFLAADLGISSPAWADRGLVACAPAIAGGASPNQLVQWQRGVEAIIFALYNTLGYLPYVDKKMLAGEYADRHGSSAILRKPYRFIATTGDSPTIQGLIEESVVATIQPPINVMVNPQGAEIPLILGNSFKQWEERVAPKMAHAVAVKIDANVGTQIQTGVANFVGTPGTDPATLANIGAGARRMDELGIPANDRVLILNPAARASVFWGPTGLTSNFVAEVIGEAEKTGEAKVPITTYKRILMSQDTPTRTVGTFHAGATVNGAGQSGSVLLTTGWTQNDTLNAGDVITVAGMNLVNWETRNSMSVLQPLLVTAACVADATGSMNPVSGGLGIPVYPPINPPVAGSPTQYQTVDSFPAAGAAITVLSGTSAGVFRESAAFQCDSLGIASIDLPEYMSAEFCKTSRLPEDFGGGLAVRMWIGPDIFNNGEYFRLDWQGVAGVLFRPEGIVRITS